MLRWEKKIGHQLISKICLLTLELEFTHKFTDCG